MPGSTKALAVLTVGSLVVVTAYSVTIGSDGWLWFTWVMLGLMTIGASATRRT